MANMTKVAKFNAIAKALEDNGIILDGFDAQEFISNEIAQVEKRNARKSNSPTKTQKENNAIKAQIVDTLGGSNDGMTATEVAKALDLNSPQKASALLKQLIDAKQVTKAKVGKTMVFTLA